MEPHKIWVEQCEAAAEGVEDEFGTQAEGNQDVQSAGGVVDASSHVQKRPEHMMPGDGDHEFNAGNDAHDSDLGEFVLNTCREVARAHRARQA